MLPAGLTTDAGHDRLQFGIRRPAGPPPFYSELLRRAQAAPTSAGPWPQGFGANDRSGAPGQVRAA
jgi:hypothetical protein